jgi:hypothetical protein
VNQLAGGSGSDLQLPVCAFYGRQAAQNDVPKISAPLLAFISQGNDQAVKRRHPGI